jgi:phytanoyl-CoA hydroxylase
MQNQAKLIINEFNQKGFYLFKNALDEKCLKNFIDDTNLLLMNNMAFFKKNDLLRNDRLFRVVNIHLLMQSARKLFLKVPDQVEFLIDNFLGKACVYTSLYFESGSEQPLHRDSPYFFTNPPYNYLGFWCALENVNELNGPLTLVEGSHMIPEPDLDRLKYKRFGDSPCPSSDDELFNSYNESVIELCKQKKLNQINCYLEKGDILIWHPSLLHGGSAHRNKLKSRKSIVFHITSEYTPVKHMDYFFDKTKKMPPKSEWDYFKDGNRLFADLKKIDFLHKINFDPINFTKDFKIKSKFFGLF